MFIMAVTLFAFEEMKHNIHFFEKRLKRLWQQHPQNAQSLDMKVASINYARKETWRTLNGNKSPRAEVVWNKTAPPFCSWRPPLFLCEVKDPFECDINQLTDSHLPLCGEIEAPLVTPVPRLFIMSCALWSVIYLRDEHCARYLTINNLTSEDIRRTRIIYFGFEFP